MSATAGLAAIPLDLCIGGTLGNLPLTERQLVHTRSWRLGNWLWFRFWNWFWLVLFGCCGLGSCCWLCCGCRSCWVLLLLYGTNALIRKVVLHDIKINLVDSAAAYKGIASGCLFQDRSLKRADVICVLTENVSQGSLPDFFHQWFR